ncbi:MAG TPA: low temperature requirement protein A [Polyangiaceae bacterium]|nr:low temperature requirement protein A [Polyangiaceae bacterium]
MTFVELFFDLVFVFAVTQLSHRLLGSLTLLGALQTAMLALAVWWVWIYTSWITNWLDPDRPPVRLLIFALMLAGIGLSTSIPGAFEARSLPFAAAHASMQVGRTLFMTLAIPPSQATLRLNFQRIAVWLATSALFWLAGGLSSGSNQLALWGIALAIEYVSPIARFWVPGLGASSVSDWSIEGGHLAERCALFVIIALGESVLVTGAALSAAVWTGEALAAFGASFAGSVAMWWIYFDRGADLGSQQIMASKDPGRLGRLVYTYLHLPIVLGIILSAVADELVMAHPSGHVHVEAAVSLIGGPLLYLAGAISFKRAVRGWWQPSHLAGIGALVLLSLVTPWLSQLLLGALTTLVLIIVAAWETLSLTPRRR